MICPICGRTAEEHGCDVCGLTYQEMIEENDE